MARIRTIKPEFWSSEQVVDCSPMARLLFIGLWNFCDDSGIHPRSARRLKMLIFPADDFTADQVDGWIDELSEAGLVTNYLVSQKPYLKVTGWAHQRIDRPSFRYPLPTGEIPENAKNPEIQNDSKRTRRILAERSTTESEVGSRNRKSESELEVVTGRSTSTDRGATDEDDQKEISIEDDEVRDTANRIGRVLGLAAKPQDRSLVLKVAWLSVHKFGEAWLVDALEGFSKAKERPRKPYGYLHTCLTNSCRDKLECNFKRELARLIVPNELLEMPPPRKRDERLCAASSPED